MRGARVRIGVDVGGTNTDAVLIDGDKVLAICKCPTSADVSTGIIQAVSFILNESDVAASAIKCVMIGTTHFTNAFVERKHLLEVGVIRICLPAARGIPPMLDWPDDLKSIIGNNQFMIQGGYQFNGALNAPLDKGALRACAKTLKSKGIQTIAITGLFSSIRGDMELEAAEIIREEMGNVSISLSHQVGRGGILERENATIMNACLADISKSVVSAFNNALSTLNIKAPFFVSQNDGTLMTAANVEKYPVLTFASGPTNSMRGAAYLSGVKNALVADIGGTTTDIGMLSNGFPRESSVTVDIGGVRTNFRMPDILALGLGGGTVVSVNDDGSVKIGPQSVGYRLLTDGLVFGGDTLTTTDITVASGNANIGNKKLVSDLRIDAPQVSNLIHQIVEDGIDRMKTNADKIPFILVGGGAILIYKPLKGVSETIVPKYAGVANAIGASIAQVAAEIDKIVCFGNDNRKTLLEDIKREAKERAVASGALKDSIEVIDIEEIPLAYAPNNAVRVRIKVAGNLNIDAFHTQEIV